jgi:DNA mismatch endonuclease (patch repair protein)
MDVHTTTQRSGNMAAIKGKDTKPEMMVRRLLHRMGYRYVLHGKKLPGRPDLVFTARRKIVFVHGCFWHMHECRWGRVIPATRTEFWQSKRTANVVRDRATEETLRIQGWHALVVWECETRDLPALTDRLVAFLDSDMPPPCVSNKHPRLT